MQLTKPKKLFSIFCLFLCCYLVSCAQKEEIVVVVDPFAGVTDPEQIRLIRIRLFGPDPYVSKAPLVPDPAKKEFEQAMEKLNSGDDAGAVTQLKAMVKAYTSLSGPAYNLAVLELKKGKKKQAKKHLKLAIERNAYNLNAKNMYALMLRGEGDFAGAEKEYLEIIKLWEGYLPVYKNLGILYDNLYMGKPEQALPHYKNYNSLLEKPDRQVNGWIVDIERQLKVKEIKPVEEVAPVEESPQVEESAPTEQAQTDHVIESQVGEQ